MVRLIVSVLISTVLSATLVAVPKSIRDVDFKNLAYPWDERSFHGVPGTWHWLSHLPQSKVTLTQGQKDFPPPGAKEPRSPYDSYPHVTFESVTYGDLNNDGLEEAAVDLHYGTGGTATWDYLYIYTLDHGSPKLLAMLESGSRAYGGLTRLSIEGGELVLDFMDRDKRRGDCCSEGYIRVHYRWKQGHFIEQGERTYGPLKWEVIPTKEWWED